MSVSALDAAISGLKISNKGLDVTSRNISNATTEGYTAKDVQQETLIIDNEAAGVRFSDIRRFVDEALIGNIRRQTSLSAEFSTKQSYLDRIQSFNGPPEAETNIAAELTELKNTFSELSTTPESNTLRNKVLNQATTVANRMNAYQDLLVGMRNDIQLDMQESIRSLNGKLEQMAELNVRVRQNQVEGKSTADLEDQRDVLAKQIAELADISYFVDSDNVLVVQTASGRVIADRDPIRLRFEAIPLSERSVYPDNIGGITVEGDTQNRDLMNELDGGRLGALIELRDEIIPRYQAQIDEIAQKTALRFEAQGLTLYTNSTGTVPPDQIDQYIGFAGRMQVNDAIVNDPTLIQRGTPPTITNPGSSELLERILDFTFGRFEDATGTQHTDFRTERLGPANLINFDLTGTDVSIETFTRSFLGAQAEEASLNEESLSVEERFLSDLERRFQDESGVDTDQELARMVELQRSYQASARMVSVVQELFDELINTVR
jgi:flagellar hook-associated protein 1 FlgK